MFFFFKGKTVVTSYMGSVGQIHIEVLMVKNATSKTFFIMSLYDKVTQSRALRQCCFFIGPQGHLYPEVLPELPLFYQCKINWVALKFYSNRTVIIKVQHILHDCTEMLVLQEKQSFLHTQTFWYCMWACAHSCGLDPENL